MGFWPILGWDVLAAMRFGTIWICCSGRMPNPAVPRAPRRQITVRYSADDGASWSEGLLLDEGLSAGYSCLVQVDADTVGILYECSRAHLAFQALPLADILAGGR